MSESDVPRRMRLVAVAAALVAMGFTLIAAIVVITRDKPEPNRADTPTEHASLTDRDVRATDVVRLQRDGVEVVETPTPGLRVKDPTLAADLGLEPDDVITSLSGKPVSRELDVYDVVIKLSHMSATSVYVEVMRKNKPMLMRWKLDGDLRQARHASRPSTFGSSTTLGGLGTYTPAPIIPAPDPLLDTIVKIDDMHYQLPRKTAETLLADASSFARQARVVPAMRNGQPNGLKLYAIRPSSLYARLGFHNGDTMHAVNGHELTSMDRALDVLVQLKDSDELHFDLTRRGKPVALTIQIIK